MNILIINNLTYIKSTGPPSTRIGTDRCATVPRQGGPWERWNGLLRYPISDIRQYPSPLAFSWLSWLAGLILLLLTFCSSVEAQTLDKSVTLGFQLPSNEFFTSVLLKKNELVLFSVAVDTKRKQSTLKAYGLDAGNGEFRWKRSLDSVSVGKWQPAIEKGTIAQTFDNAVASGLRGDQAVPLLYQYRVTTSPDGNRILAYFYDYSQPNLAARTLLFDSQLSRLRNEVIPLDNRVTNHGFFVNNQGELLIMNNNGDGDIQLLQYDFDSGNRFLLEVPGSTSPGGQFRLQLSGDEAWVINTSDHFNRISGIILTRFNLKNHTTTQVQYLPLSESLRAALGSSSHYELSGCRISPRKELSLVLENKNILSSGFTYRPSAVNDLATWQPRKAMVQLEKAVAVTYDTLGISLDERIIPRDEKIDAEDAYRRVSFVVNPQTALPEWLISEKQFIRLERTRGSFKLNTYRLVTE